MASSENEAEIAEKAPSPLEDDEANAADEVAEPVTTTGTVSEAQKSDVKPEKVEDNEAEAKQEVEGDLNESTQEPDSAMMEDEENVEAKLEKIEKEDSLEKFEDANIEKVEEERKVDEISSSTTGEEIKNEIVDETKDDKGTTNEAEPKQEADLEKPTVNNEAAMKEEDSEVATKISVDEAKEEKVKEEKLIEHEVAPDAEKPNDEADKEEIPPAAVVENTQPVLQAPLLVAATAVQLPTQLDTVQPQQQVSTASDMATTSSKPVSKPVKVYALPQTKVPQGNKSPQVQQMKSPQHKSPIAANQVMPQPTPQQQQQQQQQQQTNLKMVQSSPVKSMGTAMKNNSLKSNESLLISNNNVTPVKNNPAIIHKSKPITEEDGKWHTVGIYNGLTTSVSGYIDNNLWSSAGLDLNTNNLPDLSNFARIPLEPGTAYRFRLRAINSVGASDWSEVSSFKTCLPGFPGAPSAIKISKSSEGAHLTWEPPPTCRDINEIVEYSVYLAIKPQANAKDNKTAGGARGGPAQLAFVRVYVGAANQCIVPHSSLTSAHVDCTNKPAIIFRIAARNEKGYGPATQVRWLQDAVNAAPASSTTHTGTSLLASARVKTESAGPSPSKRLKLTNATRFTANE